MSDTKPPRGKKPAPPTIDVAKVLSGPEMPPAGDPLEPFLRALTAATDDLSRAVADAKQQASGEMVRVALGKLPGAVDRLVAWRFRRFLVGLVLIGLALAFGGFGVGWWARGGPDMTCQDQKGGTVCWYWPTPPAKQ